MLLLSLPLVVLPAALHGGLEQHSDAPVVVVQVLPVQTEEDNPLVALPSGDAM